MKSAWLPLVGLVLGVTLSIGACGDDDDDGSQNSNGRGGSGGSGTAGSGASGSGNSGSGTSGTSGSGGSGAGSSGASGAAGAGGSGGAGGGASGASGAGGGGAPTSFAEAVLPQLTASACTTCHSTEFPNGPEAGLVMNYESLRNGSGPSTCGAYPTYIDTVNPEKSLLWAKVDPNEELPLDNTCGGKMPPSATGNQDLADLLRKWITEGAAP